MQFEIINGSKLQSRKNIVKRNFEYGYFCNISFLLLCVLLIVNLKIIKKIPSFYFISISKQQKKGEINTSVHLRIQIPQK